MSDFDQISAHVANACIGAQSLILLGESIPVQRVSGIRGLSYIGIEMQDSDDAKKLIYKLAQTRTNLTIRNSLNIANVDKNRVLSLLNSDKPQITQADLIQSDPAFSDVDHWRSIAGNLVGILPIEKDEVSIKHFLNEIFDNAMQVFHEEFTIDDEHKLELLLAMRKGL